MAQKVRVTFQVPNDAEFLNAVGRVTICHAYLDYCLRMCIKSLFRLPYQDAFDATVREGSRGLRDRIRKLARMRLGEGPTLLKLQAQLKRCEDLTEKRNGLTHRIIIDTGVNDERDVNESMLLPYILQQAPDASWGPAPSAADLNELAEALAALANELNDARLNGWLAVALAAKPLPPSD